MKQRLLIIFALAIVVVLGFVVLKNIKARVNPVPQSATTTEVVHCDNDAKLCPDGTTVLRTGNQCEFAACPSVYGDVSQWRARKDDNGVTFKYPETFGTNYITGNEWPPKFVVNKDVYSCDTTATTSVSEQSLNGHSYCVREQSGAAAGSTYTNYHISFPKDDKTVTMSFVIQTVQCLNYTGTEQSACQATQASFKILELVNAIAGTVGL
jgi:hypothetical protein